MMYLETRGTTIVACCNPSSRKPAIYEDLKDKVAVITGAGSGIGRATAQLRSREGCQLVLNDVNADNAEATRTSLASPDSAVILIADIGDPATADWLENLATDTYGAAKAALVNLTHTTAVENARDGIRSNVILPGPIATPPMLAAAQSPGGIEGWAAQTVPGRLGEPEEIANAICFLASKQASYINGTLLRVDGGVSARTNSPRFD